MLFSITRRHQLTYLLVNNFVRNKSAVSSGKFDVRDIKNKTKVPLKPVVNVNDIKTEKISIDESTIELLQRLALVNLSDQEALKTLEDSIEFATKILNVDTTGVEPMYFVNEDQYLMLREDEVTEGNIRDELLLNAPVNDDVCFVAPPGNIPVDLEEENLQQIKNK